MLINEIGVIDPEEFVELDERRSEPVAPDPKARETLADIVSGALRHFDTPPAPQPKPDSEVGSLSLGAGPSRSSAHSAA